MAKILLLSALLAIGTANPIIVPSFHGQIFIPIFRQQRQQQFYQHPQQQVADRSDHQGYASDYSPAHSGYPDHEDNGQANSLSHIDESSHDYGEQHQQQQPPQHDYSAFTDFNSGHDGGPDDNPEGRYDPGFEQQHIGHHYVHSVPVSEHVEVTKPVAVPVYKEIGIPVPHPVRINVPHPVTVGVPQPYPVAVPVSQPVPIQIVKTVAVPVEKKVPYPVEKHIPVPVEKPVPIRIEKHIPVPVYKPYPIKIPVYKTIYHHAKGGHSSGGGGHGHGHGHGHGYGGHGY